MSIKTQMYSKSAEKASEELTHFTYTVGDYFTCQAAPKQS